LLALSAIDWDHFIIPDELSLGMAVGGLLAAAFNPYLDAIGASWWSAPLLSLRGAIFGFGLGWAVAAAGEAFFKKEAFGGGDVKLMSAVGAWTGITGVIDCLMIACVLGSIYGLWLIRSGRAKGTDPIPFGPFLAVGAAFNFFRLLPIGWPLL
jgi:leader peptidase (prepilin peptidase)/N-methyltransferase